jgi:hypothetical protein
MNWDVVEINPTAPRTLAVRFADGLTGTIRIDPSFCTGVFQALLNDEVVKQAGIENGVVVWPNGLDLAPDTMYREIQHSSTRHYEVGRSNMVDGAGVGRFAS